MKLRILVRNDLRKMKENALLLLVYIPFWYFALINPESCQERYMWDLSKRLSKVWALSGKSLASETPSHLRAVLAFSMHKCDHRMGAGLGDLLGRRRKKEAGQEGWCLSLHILTVYQKGKLELTWSGLAWVGWREGAVGQSMLSPRKRGKVEMESLNENFPRND